MSLGDSTDQDLTMVLSDIMAIQVRLLLTTLKSSIQPLFIMHIHFCFLIAHLSGIQGIWVSGDVSEVLCPACAMWHWARVVSGVVCLPGPV